MARCFLGLAVLPLGFFALCFEPCSFCPFSGLTGGLLPMGFLAIGFLLRCLRPFLLLAGAFLLGCGLLGSGLLCSLHPLGFLAFGLGPCCLAPRGFFLAAGLALRCLLLCAGQPCGLQALGFLACCLFAGGLGAFCLLALCFLAFCREALFFFALFVLAGGCLLRDGLVVGFDLARRCHSHGGGGGLAGGQLADGLFGLCPGSFGLYGLYGLQAFGLQTGGLEPLGLLLGLFLGLLPGGFLQGGLPLGFLAFLAFQRQGLGPRSLGLLRLRDLLCCALGLFLPQRLLLRYPLILLFLAQCGGQALGLLAFGCPFGFLAGGFGPGSRPAFCGLARGFLLLGDGGARCCGGRRGSGRNGCWDGWRERDPHEFSHRGRYRWGR